MCSTGAARSGRGRRDGVGTLADGEPTKARSRFAGPGYWWATAGSPCPGRRRSATPRVGPGITAGLHSRRCRCRSRPHPDSRGCPTGGPFCRARPRSRRGGRRRLRPCPYPPPSGRRRGRPGQPDGPTRRPRARGCSPRSSRPRRRKSLGRQVVASEVYKAHQAFVRSRRTRPWWPPSSTRSRARAALPLAAAAARRPGRTRPRGRRGHPAAAAERRGLPGRDRSTGGTVELNVDLLRSSSR